MKYLFVLFSLTLFTNGCNDEETKKKAIKTAEDDIIVTYEAMSRGFYEEVQVSKIALKTTKDVNKKQYNTYDCSEEDWNEIVALLKKVDAEKLKTLKAPSSKRLHDGAPHAVLTIKYKDTEVSLNSFDHGNPPKELMAIVSKILAMAKAVDKP
ncbi:hypothetical protein [Kordia sp.]|uniref:hypothetical protein n=1 Tax=Kordia sp. TaxID=1965332 RepID=UPI003D6BAB41